jgi:hypothetical protein
VLPASPQLTAEEAGVFVLVDADAAAIVTTAGAAPRGSMGVEAASDPRRWTARVAAETAADSSVPDLHLGHHGAAWGSHAQRARSSGGAEGVREGFGPRRQLHAGTLNWSYTLGVGLMDPWVVGAHAMLVGGGFEPAAWPALLARHRVTVFTAVPTVYRQLLKYGFDGEAGRARLAL